MSIKNKKGGDLRISASAIETFNDCKRKWWYGYVERIRGPKSPAAERGDKIHDLAERYLKGEVDEEELEGEDAKWFRYLEPGLPFAPSPEEVAEGAWGVEDWVEEPCGPLNFVGKVDFYTKPLGARLDPPVIGDWKTTSNKRWRWSKTPSQLWAFLQPRVYAYALHKDDPPKSVDFQHVNLQSQGVPDAMEVWAEDVPWQEILDTWEEVTKVAEQMAAIATNNEEPTDVNPNTKACKKYGGCEYADMCPASPRNRVTPNIQQVEIEPMPINEDLAAKRAALRAKLGLAPAAAQPTITPEPKADPIVEPPASPSPKEQVEKVLAAMNAVPAAVFAQLAGQEMHAIASELGLTLDPNNNTYRKGAPEPKADPVQVFDQWGLPVREWEATNGGKLPSNAKVVAGLLVPADFDGTTAEAIERWGTPSQKAASEVLEANDPTDEPPPAIAPTTNDYDLDTKKAARIVLRALQDSGSIDKGDARDLVVAETSWKRISSKRWDEVVEAIAVTYDVLITQDGDTFALEGAPTEPVPEPHPTVGVADFAKGAAEPDLSINNGPYAPETPAFSETRHAAALQDAEAAGYERGYKAGEFAGYEAGRSDGIGKDPQPTGSPVGGCYHPVTVYINCRPTWGEITDFAVWISEAEELVAQEEGVAYYGLVPYAQGPKLVAAKVRNLVSKEGKDGVPDGLVIDSFHPCAPDCIAILSAVEGVQIVRALR